MTIRHALTWKCAFYGVLLPLLRRASPARADSVLFALGRLVSAFRPRHRRRTTAALVRARDALGADWSPAEVRAELDGNLPRFLARDYLLGGPAEPGWAGRFDVDGADVLAEATAGGRGCIVVGSHLGAYLPAVRWLCEQGPPVRLLIQRPKHVSGELSGWFDREGPHPQSGFFLRRGLSAGTAATRVLAARSALRDGLSIYLTGDVPWDGPNGRPARFLGRDRRLLAIWTDLAVLTGAPVVLAFGSHGPDGRFALRFEGLGRLAAGDEAWALASYCRRLDAEIDAHPADAVAHLTWPCYTAPTPGPTGPHLGTSGASRRPPARAVGQAG
jgi:lauroyl/myristoyl acyltransferase